MHLGLIETVIRGMKNKVRSWRAALNCIFVGGLPLWIVDVSSNSAQPPRPLASSPKALRTGETKTEKIFRRMQGEMTEASNEVLQANRTGLDRSLSMIAFYPI